MIKKTGKDAVIGDTYFRKTVEVQTLTESGKWYVQSRNCRTLEEAKLQHKSNEDRLESLKWVFDTGKKPKVRFVEVTSTCKVVG